MDNSSFIRELLTCERATVGQEWGCFSVVYSIALPSGARIKARGTRCFLFSDDQNPPIIVVNSSMKFFETLKMEVRLCNEPPLNIRRKHLTSRSVVITNENDIPVLKIRLPLMTGLHPELLVFGDNDIQVCKMKKSWREYDVEFPADLDVRYKAALLSSCIFIDALTRR